VRSTPLPAVVRLFTSTESSGLVCHVRSAPPPEVVRLLTSAETNSSVSDTGGLGPRVILLGRRFLGAEKSNRHSRQYRASSRPPQKAEIFSKLMQRYRGAPHVTQQKH
jgi:hypothetical protein